jgi:ADP-ribose pyrophosphatase YjhB (NUDIX family)
MPVDRSRIRVKAFAVLLDESRSRHAVSRMSTREHPTFHRPLGGSVELGERSADAVVREIREELDATLVDPEPWGVLENVFTINGETGHEIVFVYAGQLLEPGVIPAAGRSFMDLDEPGWVEWRALAGDPAVPLFPEGLQALIDRRMSERD